MPSTPDGKQFVEVTEREFPHHGTTHTEGSYLLVRDETAEYACDRADPPHARRVSDEEAEDENLFRRFGLLDAPEEPEESEEETAVEEEGPYHFSSSALGLLRESGESPDDYDGPATGDRPGRHVVREDVERWLEGATAPGESAEDEIPEIDITPEAAEAAEELGVDPREVEGTGEDGRILKSDIEDAAEEDSDE